MRNIDISILKKVPSLTEHITMLIRPLAPLSMVAEMPGSFYKTLRIPSKKMLCGAIENVLGWHLSYSDRKAIFNDYKTLRKAEHIKVVSHTSGSTYIPLLMDYFNIEGSITIKNLESVCFYKDLWNKSYRRADSFMHLNGCRNISIDVLKEYHSVFGDEKNDNAVKQAWFTNNLSKVPFFYTSPTDREYIYLKGAYSISLVVDSVLADMLEQGLKACNIGYLGNSEGWIDIKVVKS